MVDPSDKQQKDYDFLLKVEEEILNKLQDGKIVSSCNNVALYGVVAVSQKIQNFKNRRRLRYRS